MEQQKAVVAVAETNVALPAEVQQHLKDAIRSFRLAALAIEAWDDKPAPVRMAVEKLLGFWNRAVQFAEALMMQGESQ
jgi:hypothetical protein